MTREELLRALLLERFGPPPYRKLEDPWVLAARRRRLVEALPLDEVEPRTGKGAA